MGGDRQVAGILGTDESPPHATDPLASISLVRDPMFVGGGVLDDESKSLHMFWYRRKPGGTLIPTLGEGLGFVIHEVRWLQVILRVRIVKFNISLNPSDDTSRFRLNHRAPPCAIGPRPSLPEVS